MTTPAEPTPRCVSGVYPHLALRADLGPPRSECGVGALMSFADRLWVVTYLSHTKRTGSGTGLYEITPDLRMARRPESAEGTYANRFVHYGRNLLFIGPHVIDADRNVRTIDELVDVRLTGTATHLHDPDHKVYMLGMEGELFEVEIDTLKVTEIDRLVPRLGVKDEGKAHFKAAYTAFGRLVVVNNSYIEEDFLGDRADGRLAEWDGTDADAWKIIDRNPHVEAHGRGRFGGSIFATGWDPASALMHVYTPGNDTWTRYRLPKASHCFDHAWQTEWPRVREVEHERFLMDHHGLWYELSPHAYGNKVWGVRPISTHLWVHGDFCNWRGMLVVGADNASPAQGSNVLTAEPETGMWFGKTDDLWRYGKPSGWGGPWWSTVVEEKVPSDPFLMTGFDQKVLHLEVHEAGSDRVKVDVEVDFRGDGSWCKYATLKATAGGYTHHTFPPGFSAHWVRLVAREDCKATAQFHYT